MTENLKEEHVSFYLKIFNEHVKELLIKASSEYGPLLSLNVLCNLPSEITNFVEQMITKDLVNIDEFKQHYIGIMNDCIKRIETCNK
jgi:hypothetical protein